MRVILGVDGGGTKTTSVCMNLDTEKILAKCSTGSTNSNSVGEESARSNLVSGLEAVLSEAGQAAGEDLEIAGISLSMSGVDRPPDEERVRRWIRPLHNDSVRIIVNNDAIGALASGTGGKLEGGCVLIAGTGTIALAVNHQGERSRASGWGPLLGDGGSGFWLGSNLLQSACMAADGRSAAGEGLLRALLSHLNLTQPSDLITWAYSTTGWSHVAALAPLLLHQAQGGDPEAMTIVDEGVNHLCNNVAAAVAGARLAEAGNVGFPVVLAGGILQEVEGLVTQRLKTRLKERCPKADIVHPSVDPAIGAALVVLNVLKQTALSE